MNNTLSFHHSSFQPSDDSGERLTQIARRQRHDRRMDRGFFVAIVVLAAAAATTIGMLSRSVSKPTITSPATLSQPMH